MSIEDYFNKRISVQQFSDAVNKQHYTFAHKTIPYIVQKHLNDLVGNIFNATIQDWIFNIWLKGSEDLILNYVNLFYPKCHFFDPVDDINVIIISMPDPRIPPEAAYTAVIFIGDKNYSPSEWVRFYFTLELGLDESVFWVLGEWSDSEHINLGKFQYKPTLENFFSVVVAEVQNRLKVSSAQDMIKVNAIIHKYGILG